MLVRRFRAMSRKQNRVNGTHHRRCSFEALENRRLLAGDVKVTLVGGNLSVKGDAADNNIVITASGVSGVAGTSTTINGGTGSFALSAPLSKLSVDMGAGNDNLTINGLTVKGKATVKLGKGDDSFLIQNTTITGKLQIHNGKGHDTVLEGTGNHFTKFKPNVDATARITGVTTTSEGTLYTLNLSVTPKNKKDNVTQWSIDWGDGSAPQIVNGNPKTLTHPYA